MNHTLLKLPHLLAVILLFLVACQPNSLQRGLLQVSDNGRYLITPDGAPFYWFADTEWVLNTHSDEQVLAILDDRAAKGFSVIQIFATRMAWNRSWVLSEDWDFDLSWANFDAQGQLPFINNEVTKLNPEYWQRWSWIIDEVAARHMYVLMLIGEPARREGPAQAQNLHECYDYARQLGELFKNKKNLLISVSQDCPGTMGWGVDGFRAIAEGYADGLNGENNFDGTANYSTTFMTYHPWVTSAEWFHQDAWLDVNGIQGSRNEGDLISDKIVYDRVLETYNMSNPVKPVLFLEGSYEAEPNRGGSLPPTTPRNVRMQFYYATFAGSPGFSYGHVDNWTQAENIDYVHSAAVDQMVIAKNFMTARAWWDFEPDTSIIISGKGEGESRKVALRSVNEDACLVFFPVAEQATIDLTSLKNGLWFAEWFDPRDGHIESAGEFMHKNEMTFSPPAEWEDALLVLSAQTDEPRDK